MDAYQSLLQRFWGHENFRGIQRDIIESIAAGNDTLGLMPTGGGKSITFQVPAMLMQGTCIVITPLIALMKDQVAALRDRGIKAVAIHSGLTREQTVAAMENCILGSYKFLYISPERISSPLFMAKLAHMKVSFITVDEAHCICQWGYDFRPSYLHIAEIRKAKPDCPLLALTATATPAVVEEIQRLLLFPRENVFRMSFHRPNLAYMVYRVGDKFHGMLQMLEQVPGSCIIYTRNRQNCADLCERLVKAGIQATYYHAKLPDMEKDRRQDAWQSGEFRVMVATNAFGMGIDKPDVRLVMHADMPDSIEEYFQEAGRAGRDGKSAYAVMITDDGGPSTAMRVAQSFPSPDYIRDVYEKMCCSMSLAVGDGYNVTREFNMEHFCRNFRFHPVMLRSALAILDRAGYIEYHDEDDTVSRMRIDATRDNLLRSVDETDRRILMSVLRHHGGIFVDYIFLNEDLVSAETGVGKECVYQSLRELDRRGLISYIPQKRVPRITFKCRRVETEDIILPPEVYRERKEAYEARLKAMHEYCDNIDECRATMLLRYFGETMTCACGACDVCTNNDTGREPAEKIRASILDQLRDGPLLVRDIVLPPMQVDRVRAVLRVMIAKEEILLDGAHLLLNPTPS